MLTRKNNPKKAIHYLAFVASLPILLASLTNLTSELVGSSNPEIALQFNPLNLEARVESIRSKLGEGGTVEEFEGAVLETRKSIAYEPFNATLYALLGFEHERLAKGDAQKLYDYALKLDQANIAALFAKLQYYVANKNPVEVMKIAILIYRAWPQNWDIVEPNLPVILSDSKAYEIARDEFAKEPGGPYKIAYSLTKLDNGSQFAVKLLLDWHKMGVPDLKQAINVVSERLISLKQYFQAYSLFLFSMDENEQTEAGYIFNKDFKLEPTGNIFDWQTLSKPGISSQIVRFPGVNGNPSDNYLEIKFLDTPIRLDEALQYTRLPKAKMVWKATYSTKNLKTPKPLMLAIACVNDNRILASFEIDPGDRRTQNLEFDVPNANCDLQTIRIMNRNLVESWKNRYSGSLVIHNLAIMLSS